MPITSLYIHVPFCVHRCGYCDFNTYAGIQQLIPEYISAAIAELEYISKASPERIKIHTVYFGGGTPSLISPDDIKRVIESIRENYELFDNHEITLEANPGTVTPGYLTQLNAAGINRISLGMQSVHSDELALLERQHSFEDVVNAVEWTRAAGINNLNLDLIFGLPGQDLDHWQASLEAAIALQPVHLSLYALTLEHGTSLLHKVNAGILAKPDNDVAADIYEAARERLFTGGFVHYEISNWAKNKGTGDTYACKHNLQYWHTLPYLGVGAGAHGFINHYRTENIAHPVAYIKRIREYSSEPKKLVFPYTPATIQAIFINQETEIGEMMMMGLRLVQEGILNQEFHRRYGVTLQDKFHKQIEKLTNSGLLEWSGVQNEKLRLTQRGQLLGNQVFCEFI